MKPLRLQRRLNAGDHARTSIRALETQQKKLLISLENCAEAILAMTWTDDENIYKGEKRMAERALGLVQEIKRKRNDD